MFTCETVKMANLFKIPTVLISIFFTRFAISIGITLCYRWNSALFTREPVDYYAKSGDDAVFTCAATNINATTDSFVWLVGPDLYRKDVHNTYDAGSNTLRSSVTVYSVGKIRVHVTCTLNFIVQSDFDVLYPYHESCHMTRGATLYVVYFPKQIELTCKPDIPVTLHEGELMHVRCEVPRCEPAVDLSLNIDDQDSNITLPLSYLHDQGHTRILTNGIRITRDYHLKYVNCLVTSEVAFPSKSLVCDLGPINVLHSPDVIVYPPQSNITLEQPISLICMASGYPKVITFFWKCSPEGLLGGCNSTSENITISMLNESGDNHMDIKHVDVSCTATNSEGRGIGAAKVTIQMSTYDSEYFALYDMATHFNVIIAKSLVQGKIFCSIYPPQRGERTVRFKWYINNLLIMKDNGHYVVKDRSPSKSSLTFLSTIQLNSINTLTCKVIFQNETKVASIDLNITVLENTRIYYSNTYDISTHSHSTMSVPKTSNVHSNDKKVTTLRKEYPLEKPTEILDIIANNRFHLSSNDNKSMYLNRPTYMEENTANTDVLQRNELPMWQMSVIIVTGVVAFVLLIACTIVLFAMIVCKNGTQTLDPQSIKPGMISCDIPAHNNHARSLPEPVYEVPNVLAPLRIDLQSLPMTPTYEIDTKAMLSNTEHTYQSRVFHEPCIGTSSESSWTSSSNRDMETNLPECVDAENATSSRESINGDLFFDNTKDLPEPSFNCHAIIIDCPDIPLPVFLKAHTSGSPDVAHLPLPPLPLQ